MQCADLGWVHGDATRRRDGISKKFGPGHAGIVQAEAYRFQPAKTGSFVQNLRRRPTGIFPDSGDVSIS